jgi:hypothetical protein
MCGSCDKVDVSLLLMLLLLFSLHDQNTDWIISGFWRTMMIILFFSSLTTTRSWLSYVLFASLSFSCRSSFFILSVSLSLFHLITIAVFIHWLELPPTRSHRNIKTSSSSLLSSLSFRRPLENLKASIDNKGKSVLFRDNAYQADVLIVDELLFTYVFWCTTYIYS